MASRIAKIKPTMFKKVVDFGFGKSCRKLLCFCLAVILSFSNISSVFSLSEDMLDRYAQDDIMFYDPTEVETNCVPGGTLNLPGANIAEKVWNWLVNYLNTQNVADKNTSAIVSGIMGNFYIESGLNPLMTGAPPNTSYVGLYMLYKDYGGDDYKTKAIEALGNDYFKSPGEWGGWWNKKVTYDGKADQDLKDTGLTDEQINKALEINLNVLVESSTWTEFINGVKEWGVADTARGYSDLFLVTVERATGGDDNIEDPAVASHYNGKYQEAGNRRDSAQRFYDEYASASAVNPNVAYIGSTTTASTASNTNYAGDEVWNADQMAKVEKYKSVYESAAQNYGLSWQLLATMHRLEHGLAVDNPSNGQGVYQLYSYTNGGTNSNRFEPGPIDDAEFQRQTNLAAEIMKGIIEGGGYDPKSDEGIKYLIFSYNGKASQYKQKALDMGFSQAEADVGEGSPYVMNRYDARRDPNSSSMDPKWPGRFVADGVYDSSSTMSDFGGFVLYTALGGGNMGGCSATSTGSVEALIELIKEIAWPTFDNGSHTTPMTKYQEIANKWVGASKYTGCNNHGPAEDCGAFVTIALVESGFDPDYNGGGGKGSGPVSSTYSSGTGQLYYVQHSDKWELVNADWNTPISDESVLSPGDVGFSSGCSSNPSAPNCGHTFLYIGEVEGFEKHIVSASCRQRFPSAGYEAITSGSSGGITRWYHKVR